jgi:hypothetical protein
MKPKLKPPGTERLKLMYDILLSTAAFKCKLRRYVKGAPNYIIDKCTNYMAGNYTRPLFRST